MVLAATTFCMSGLVGCSARHTGLLHHACVNTYACLQIDVYMCTHLQFHMQIHVHVLDTFHGYMHAYKQTSKHTYVHGDTYMHPSTSISRYVHIHKYTCVDIHIQMHTVFPHRRVYMPTGKHMREVCSHKYVLLSLNVSDLVLLALVFC